MNGEYLWSWKEVVAACFNVLAVNSPGEKKLEMTQRD
jgi:hypothetical protein